MRKFYTMLAILIFPHALLFPNPGKLPISEPGTLVRELTVAKPAVSYLKCHFSPCGRYLYYSESCPEQDALTLYWRLQVLDIGTGKVKTLFPRFEVGFGDFALSPNGQYLALPHEPDDVAVYSLPELRLLARYQLKNVPLVLRFSADGSYLFASAGYTHIKDDPIFGGLRKPASQVAIYRTQDWKEVANLQILELGIRGSSVIYDILHIPNSEMFVVRTGADLYVYDFDGTLVSQLMPAQVSGVTIDPKMKVLASSYLTGEIRFFDLEKIRQWDRLNTLISKPTYVIRSLATEYWWLRFSPNGRWLFVGAGLIDPPHQDDVRAGVIQVYDVEKKALEAVWQPTKYNKDMPYLWATFTPDGKYLAVLDGPRTSILRIWKLPEKYYKQ